MKIKKGANIQGLDIRMRPVLVEADKIWRELGHELVITSGLDGEHSAGSLHYYGLAVDLRTNYFTDKEKATAADRLRRRLDPPFNWRYDIVVEQTHIHAECDG